MLIFSEIKKLVKNKSFLLYILLLVLVNLFLIWFFSQPNVNNAPQSAYRMISSELADLSMEQKGEFLSERFEYIEAMYQLNEIYAEQTMYGDDNQYVMGLLDIHADKVEKYSDAYAKGIELRYTESLNLELSFINDIYREYQQVLGYEQFLTDIEDAGNNLSSISIFADTDSYDNKNIVSTQQAYQNMRGTEIEYHPQKGIETATDFYATDIILIFVMILISFTLMQKEKESGMLRLIRCTKGGRANTAMAKLVALSTVLFAVVVILYGTNLVFCGITYGLGDLGRTVQSVPFLMRSTMKLTVAEYLLVFMITKWMAAIVIGIWILLSMLIANRLIHGLILSTSLPIFFFLVRQAIPATSTLNVFRYANPISYLQTDEILGSYRNLHWFGGVISMVTVEFVSALIICAIILTIYFLLFNLGQFNSMGRSMLYLPRLKKFRLTTVFKTEWRKLLMLGGGLMVILVAIAYQGYQLYSYDVYFDLSETIYKNYLVELSGPLNEEKGEMLRAEEERFTEIEELENQLRYGAISEQEFNIALANRYSEYEEYKVFKQILGKVDYINSTPGAQLLYDSGYTRLFEFNSNNYGNSFSSTVIAILMTVVILGSYFSIERISGVRRILYSTPLGREQTVKTKLINSAVICFVIAIVTTLPEILKIYKVFGLDGVMYPANSLAQFSGISPFVSILMVILLHFILRVVAIVFVAAVTLTLSQYNDSYITVVMTALTIFLMPLILMYIGLDFASWITIYPQFNIAVLLSQGILQTVTTFFFAVVMAYASYILSERMIDKYCWNFTDI